MWFAKLIKSTYFQCVRKQKAISMPTSDSVGLGSKKGAPMPTIITHGFTAIIIGKLLCRHARSYRFWFWTILCSILPDLDVVGFFFGIKYGDLWGHRGMTHSLFFAAIVGVVIGQFYARKLKRKFMHRESWFWSVFFAVIIASHGIFDALTNGGLGIAFFSPFDPTRYFLPVTPVQVSPIGIQGFFSQRGLNLMISETTYITFPLLCLLLSHWTINWLRKGVKK